MREDDKKRDYQKSESGEKWLLVGKVGKDDVVWMRKARMK